MKYLRFESELAMLGALAEHLVKGTVPAYIGAAAVDVVGVVYQPTGAMLETDMGQVPEFAPTPGWHVNLSDTVPALAQFEIPTPTNPSRVFAIEPEPLRVPHSCTRRQGQRALLEAGKLDSVETAISSISDPFQKRVAQVEYEAATWERSNPFLIGMWSQLGGTDEELDGLFRLAVTF